jgi:hypothetical protein
MAHAAASDAPLLAGPLYGLRTWRIVRDDGGERLSAPLRGTPWLLDDRWVQATCEHGHTAPGAGCVCGIHAWHPRPAFARRVLSCRFELPGIVEADGAVEVHEDGFRAERHRAKARRRRDDALKVALAVAVLALLVVAGRLSGAL